MYRMKKIANPDNYDLTSVDENGMVVNGAGKQLDETTTSPNSNSINSSSNNVTMIDGDALVNATRGKVAVLTCIVHNLKNYKVRRQ